jgi:hypothetical protein
MKRIELSAPSLNAIPTPFGIILPLSEVKGRAIVDALDRCGGNYLFASRLLGIGRSGLSHREDVHYQPPRVEAQRLMSISQGESSFDPRECMVEHMRTNDALSVGENTALLHAIFPRYLDLLGRNQRGGEYLLARSAIPEFTWACVRKASPCS